MSETDEQAAIDTLCRYYDAISSGDYSEIPKLCAEVLSVISLYGTATLTSGEAIVQTYENIWASWNDQGIMQKIGYDREQFKVINVQDNVKLVQTELTNYNKDGGERSSWNCTYVMVKHNNEWLMSLATSDNVASTTIQDGKV